MEFSFQRTVIDEQPGLYIKFSSEAYLSNLLATHSESILKS